MVEPVSLGTKGQPIKFLLLASGLSSRMGSPKFLLPHPDGRPSYLHTFQTLHSACRGATGAFVALRNPASHPGLRLQSLPDLPIQPLFESDLVGVDSEPTVIRSLLCAFQQDSTARWLVMPCDFPLMSVKEVENLLMHYQEPVTCLEDGRGHLQPLTAVWGPAALAYLAENLGTGDIHGDLGAAFVALRGTRVRPRYDHSFFNTNDREDWEDAIRLLANQEGPGLESTPQINIANPAGVTPDLHGHSVSTISRRGGGTA